MSLTCTRVGRNSLYKRGDSPVNSDTLSDEERERVPCVPPSELIRDTSGRRHRYACVDTYIDEKKRTTYFRDGIAINTSQVPKEQQPFIRCGTQLPGEKPLVLRTSSKPITRRTTKDHVARPLRVPAQPDKPPARPPPKPPVKQLPKPTTKQRREQRAIPLPAPPLRRSPQRAAKVVANNQILAQSPSRRQPVRARANPIPKAQLKPILRPRA